jgi:RecA-family ATPase
MSDEYANLGPLGFRQFLLQPWPEPEFLLEPLIRTASNNMVAGQREAGKSWLSMSMALACATGTTTLNGLLHAPRRVKTLYVDGENGAVESAQRFTMLQRHLPVNAAEPDLDILVPERCPDGLVYDLVSEQGQSYYLDLIATNGYEFVCFDNLSVLAGGIDENSAQDYQPVQDFFLRLKALGVATVAVAHVGKDKSRGPRGSSKRTDALSTLVVVSKPESEAAGDSLKLEWRVEKARHRIPASVRQPLVAELLDTGWATQPLAATAGIEDILAMKAAGMSGHAIARELGLSKSEVYRRLEAAKGGGQS